MDAPRHFVADGAPKDALPIDAVTGVRTIGVDYRSVGGYARNGVEPHTALLKAGVWIIDRLDLSAIAPGDYEPACLPIKLVGADGAPARAALGARD